MKASIERLLTRLASALSVSAIVASLPQTANATVRITPPPDNGMDNLDRHDDRPQAAKLVFGRAIGAGPILAAHRSHSSHSSHRSHSSHYSGGATQRSYTPPSQTAPAVTTYNAQAPKRIPAAVLAKLPRLRSHWPKTVTLKARSYFNIVENNRPLGIRTVDAGTVVPLVEVKVEHAIIIVGGSKTPMLVEQCDLVELMGGELAILSLPDDPVVTPQGVVPATTKTAPSPAGLPEVESSKR